MNEHLENVFVEFVMWIVAGGLKLINGSIYQVTRSTLLGTANWILANEKLVVFEGLWSAKAM